MTCGKCGGLLVAERELESGDGWRCINCGRREAMKDQAREDAKSAAGGGNPNAMPKRRGRPPGKRLGRQPGTRQGRPPRGSAIDQLLGEIDTKIAQLQAAKQLIEQSREILS